MATLTVLLKEVGKPGRICIIENTNNALENIVGKNALVNSFTLNDIVIFSQTNEYGLPVVGDYNCTINGLAFYGNLVFAGANATGEVVDLTEEQQFNLLQLTSSLFSSNKPFTILV